MDRMWEETYRKGQASIKDSFYAVAIAIPIVRMEGVIVALSFISTSSINPAFNIKSERGDQIQV